MPLRFAINNTRSELCSIKKLKQSKLFHFELKITEQITQKVISKVPTLNQSIENLATVEHS